MDAPTPSLPTLTPTTHSSPPLSPYATTLPRHSPHQSLQKLTQQFLNKKEIQSPPEDVGVDRTENRYQHFMQERGDGDKEREGGGGVTK